MNRDRVSIVVVEDDPIVSMDIEESLCGAGFTVSGLVTSVAGVRKLLSSRLPDLIVLDLDLTELTVPLPWFGVPVVLITSLPATAAKDVFPLAHPCPCDSLRKPFLDDHLITAIECVLRSGSSYRSAPSSALTCS
jgi:DNA-binding response OmpR family regulator